MKSGIFQLFDLYFTVIQVFEQHEFRIVCHPTLEKYKLCEHVRTEITTFGFFLTSMFINETI